MAAYVIAQIEVTDWEKFQAYIKEAPRTISQYGGKYIARGGESVVLEGDAQNKRMVLIEFPSLQHAKDWYNSEEYRQIKPLRMDAAQGLLIAVEGC